MGIEPLDQELKQKLPSPQGIALAIMDACRREDVTVGDIGSLVESDPALSGRLLEQANSAAMGGRPIGSAAQAVNRLGLESVRQLALCFSLIDSYSSGKCDGFDYELFWSHSLLMGFATREFGVAVKLGADDELFTAGLLARTGELALATAYPSDYGKLVATRTQGAKLLLLEQKFLHTDHLQLSAAMLTQWGIPEIFVQAVLFHEDPNSNRVENTHRSWHMCRVIQLAHRLADFVLAPKETQPAQVPMLTELANGLGLNTQELGEIVNRVVAQWRLWGERLKVRTSTIRSFASIASEQTRPDQEVNAVWLRVLIVEDDPIALGILEEWLGKECGYTVRTAANGADALQLALDFVPHVVLTDWRMPVMDGLMLCKLLRDSEWGQNIYIIMLTGADEESELVEAFAAGVDDFLTKPVNMVALRARLKAAWRFVRLREAWEQDHERLSKLAAELALSNRRLQHASMTDPLTELANRRSGLVALSQAWSASVRHGQALTLISLDIDHFKSINDLYGHPAGDAVLQHLGHNLRSMARQEDYVCRWGGEEFLIICPNLDGSNGILAAERIRKHIAATPIDVGVKSLQITVSFGVASWQPGMQSVEQLLKCADEALYQAKESGRNRVFVWTSNPSSK